MSRDAAPASILVRAPNWAGDVVMSTPGLRALRAAHPSARIAVQVRAGLEPLLRGAPWQDEILPVAADLRGARSIWRAGREFRREHGRFDLGICIPESFSSALLMRAAGVRCIAGFRRGGRAPLLHRALSAPPEWGKRRLVARERFVLELLRSVGVPEKGTELELFVTREERDSADRALAGAGVASDRPLAVLAPGAGFGSSKCWPAESFAAVGDALAEKGASVILMGTAAERELCERVRGAMQRPAANLAGEGDLGFAKSLLERAALLVCNDAGARHIAVAFGVPSVVVFGPTSLQKTNLNLDSVRVVEEQGIDCRPCYQRECPIDHRCMTRISPIRVAREALLALEGTGR